MGAVGAAVMLRPPDGDEQLQVNQCRKRMADCTAPCFAMAEGSPP